METWEVIKAVLWPILLMGYPAGVAMILLIALRLYFFRPDLGD